MPAATSSSSRLTDSELSYVLGRAHQLMIDNLLALDQTELALDRYLQSWCAVTKLQAIPAKLERGEYVILPPVDLFSIEGENDDRSVMAFTLPRGVVRIDFSRGSDGEVFAVLDACARNQQASWDSEVRAFNSKPDSVREQLIASHRQAEASLARIYDEISQSSDATRAEVVRARTQQIRSLQDCMLPYYMVLPKKGSTAWARRSIGR